MSDDGSALQFVSEDVNEHVLEMVDVIARHVTAESVIGVLAESFTQIRTDYPSISDEDWERVRQRLAVIVKELYPDTCLFQQAYGFLHGRQMRGEA
jgi:hypothetical protein